MNITVLDGYALNPGDLSWDGIAKLGNFKLYDRTSPDDVLSRSIDSEVLITNKTVLDGEMLRKLPKLKYVGVLATGYNVVDIDVAKDLGIVVTNIPAYSTMSVVQMVFALLFAVTNRVEHYTAEVHEGRWSSNPDFCYWDTPLMELSGKTFGIVGLGHIGMAVAKIALTFGMRVIAYTSKDAGSLPEGIEKRELDDLFMESDVVSLHCPLNDSTKGMVNSYRLSQMKSNAILINTGRGPLVDEDALAEALKSGKIAAACADVLSSEPPNKENPLLSSPNFYVTPHIAWATLEARRRLMEIATSNLKAFLEGSPVNNVAR